ncbi:hypothetical protein N7466_005242 [Penicillium verhagenii]|uniref:uncharacterized protein n=1 Tax=Penicillium verhagenii TaxID=1562060 RepID=UPI002544F0C8|nr:uncharacterized protein N7466_005242 [Penicillium verhagenii]KAJ5935695.1 hypothetical protein N7466_005242 [Penicillium verhagenii]
MKLTLAAALFLLCSTGVTSLPTNPQPGIETFGVPVDYEVKLEKRRGGGGSSSSSGSSSGGSSGGRSGSSSSSSGSGSSRGGSSSSGSSSSSSGSTGKTSSSSNTGGTTSKGSGTTASYGGNRYDSTFYGGYIPSIGYIDFNWPWTYYSEAPSEKISTNRKYNGRTYGANRYYAGGATTPYRAGSRSALGITPFLLPVAALAFFPGLWYHPAYVYDYNDNYNYVDDSTKKNVSMPVACLCEEYQECGCDNNTNSTYYESLFNGTQPKNSSVVTVAKVNDTEKIYINGTLANGTTAADSSAASGAMATMLQASGYWATAAVVLATVWGI